MIVRRCIGVLGLIAAVSLALAQPLSYAQKIVPVRAGILIIESQRTAPIGPFPNGIPLNPEPHVWSNIDADLSAKPAGLSFFNPRASTVLTDVQRQRWSYLTSGSLPPVNSRLTKRDAPYWEVMLASTSDEVLAGYDALYLSVRNGLTLNPLERERLRRYMDQGGILFVDLLQTPTLLVDLANSLPVPFDIQRNTSGPLTFDPNHPLMSYPNSVTIDDINAIQAGTGDVLKAVTGNPAGAIEPIEAWLQPDSFRIQPVAGNSTGATLASAQVGDGFLVVTTRSVSAILNRGLTGSAIDPNVGFTSTGPVRDSLFTAAAKIVVNGVHLSSGFPTLAKGGRRSYTSPIDISAPLLKRFGIGLPNGDPMTLTNRQTPVVYKGRIYVISGERLFVFDADPKRDLDNDGNPDDGEPDLPGYDGDLLWSSGRIFPPPATVACSEVPNSQIVNGARNNALVTDMAFVTQSDGTIAVFDVDTPTGPSLTPVTVISPIERSRFDSNGPYTPTIHEGVGFAVDTRDQDGSGRIWVFDPATGGQLVSDGPWQLFGTARMGEPVASPTIGYIPIKDNSGGVDKVVYVPTKANDSSTPGADRPAGFVSLWFGVRGEKPTGIARAGNQLRVSTRASLQGLPVYLPGGSSGLGVKISVLDRNGNPYNLGQLQGTFTGSVSQSTPGELFVGLTGAGMALNWDGADPDVTIRIDYTLDWGKTSPGPGAVASESFIRGNIDLPDDINFGKQIQGNIVMAPNGNLFVVTGGQRGGTLFCFREEGRGDFNLLYRWDMYEALNIRLNRNSPTVTTVPYRETVIDEDYITQAFPILGGPLKNPRFVSGPAVRGDTVYVMALGQKGGFNIPTGVLLAFNANPRPIEFEVDNMSSGFSIIQPDVDRSNDAGPPTYTPSIYSTLLPGQFTYEQDPVTLKGKIRIESLMNVKRGRIRDSISTSLPVILTRAGNTDVMVEPERGTGDGVSVPGFAGGKWSPLRWYTVLQGFRPSSPPLVTGNTLYAAGASSLPNIITGSGFAPRGLLFGMDSQLSPNDSFLKSNSVKPWMQQLYQLVPSAQAPGFAPNPDVRWPQTQGVRSFFEWRVRFLQTAMGATEPIANGVVGGDGTLVTWSNSRLYAYSRMDFYVADEGRVSRFDPSGNPIWMTDGSTSSGVNVPVSTSGSGLPLSRPTRVYPGGENSYWIVDTGNDRIIRLDSSGKELRSINSFKQDPNAQTQGMIDNETTLLRQPRDVLIYTTTVAPNSAGFSQGINPPQPLNTLNELWIHYLIADTGNYRMVELIDRYWIDRTSGRILDVVQYNGPPSSTKPGKFERALGVLAWHSPSDLSGRQYAYNSIDRTFVSDGAGGVKPIIAFGFGNYEPGRASFGLDTTNQQVDKASGLGGIVLYDPLAGATQVINEVQVPAIASNILYDEQAGAWTAPARPGKRAKINGLSSVALRYTTTSSGPQLSVMYTDNSGAYEVVQASPGSGTWIVNWMLPNEVFRTMKRNFGDDLPGPSNPENARLYYARRLNSDQVMIVNGYFGRRRDTLPYTGSVMLVDGTFGGGPNEPGYDLAKRNIGFNSLSVISELPPVVGARQLSVPVFADRR